MKLNQPNAGLYVPDGASASEALARVTHLGVGAHHDDLEFMAYHGILACYEHADRWFGGVTCTNGSGSARTGSFADYTDEEMMAVRREEQNEAARIGQYGFMVQLDYPSAAVKRAADPRVIDDVARLIAAARPRVVYTHNPADKHETHIGVTLAVLAALRAVPPSARPEQLLGCEVWRDLDWLPDADKVVLDVSGRPELAARLNGVFASQIAGGKRYDLAVDGRRRANATFFESHATDELERAWFAMDLTPLLQDDTADLVDHTLSLIDRFRADVAQKLRARP